MTTSRVGRFIKEARRRRVFRGAGLYIVGAWVILQVADMAFPALDVPDSAIRYVWIALFIGFPIALIFGWRYEIRGGHLVRTRGVSKEVNLSLQRTDYTILVALIAVVAAIAIGTVGNISQTQSIAEDSHWVNDLGPTSIAVLPFVNMSPDPDNAYFADGISEQLLNGLAKLRGLQVIARTSSFSLRDKNLSIQQIGERLGVTNILEGSIRVAGNTIRVTAQLIDSRNGVHLWSETYDRSKDDILAVQDDIARNVLAALKETLDIEDTQQTSVMSTENMEAYRYYLQGSASMKAPWDDASNTMKATEYYKLAVEADPHYSDAYVALANAYRILSDHYAFKSATYEEDDHASKMTVFSELAKEAAVTAIELAPQGAAGMWARYMISDDLKEQEHILRGLIARYPNESEAYHSLAHLLLENGAVSEGAEITRRAFELDPLHADDTYMMSLVLALEGKLKDASVLYLLSGEQAGVYPENDTEERELELERFGSLPLLPRDLDFEGNGRAWYFPKRCESRFSFSMSEDAYSGQQSGQLGSFGDGWCTVSQEISAEEYQDKYVRLVGMIKTDAITDYAKLGVTVSDAGGTINFADRWPSHITEDVDWTEYEVRIYVPARAQSIRLFVSLEGEGRAWIDDFRFQASDSPLFD